jgi:hypothetical protein
MVNERKAGELPTTRSSISGPAGLHFGNTRDGLNVPHGISGTNMRSWKCRINAPHCGRSAEVGAVILRQVRKRRGIAGTLESGSGARATSQVVRAEPMSTLDAELNDFGAQLAIIGGHAADRDG